MKHETLAILTKCRMEKSEELINYEDEHDIVPMVLASTSSSATGAVQVDGEGVKNKKNFTGLPLGAFYLFILARCSCTPKGLLVEA
jgi:hypothetical protein